MAGSEVLDDARSTPVAAGRCPSAAPSIEEALMAKTRDLEQCDPVDQGQRDARHVLIGKHVLNGLGEPNDLLQIQVRPLWDRRYRVNIVVGVDITSARVANSYFLE